MFCTHRLDAKALVTAEKNRLKKIANTEALQKIQDEQNILQEAENKKQALIQAREDRKKEMIEMKVMSENDINAIVDDVGDISDDEEWADDDEENEFAQDEAEVEEKKAPQQERFTGVKYVEPEIENSAKERDKQLARARIQTFITNVSNKHELFSSHPRNQSGSNFFMPLNFASDISFNPFDLRVDDNTNPNDTDNPITYDDDNENPAPDFSDLTKMKKDHKDKMERENANRLRMDPEKEIPSAVYTKMFKSNRIDWDAHMISEIHKVVGDKEEVQLTEQQKKDLQMKSFRLNSRKSRRSSVTSSDKAEDSSSLFPLPFGIPTQCRVLAKRFRLFQVSVHSSCRLCLFCTSFTFLFSFICYYI